MKKKIKSMTSKNATKQTQANGGPAFPIMESLDHVSRGLSLRDVFAAAALCGLTSAHQRFAKTKAIAEHAYAVADMMLEARSNTAPPT